MLHTSIYKKTKIFYKHIKVMRNIFKKIFEFFTEVNYALRDINEKGMGPK
jgi:hypothetical protein